jgi:hypothetical protein
VEERVIVRRKLVLEAIALMYGIRAIVVMPALGNVNIPSYHSTKHKIAEQEQHSQCTESH